ncbi:NADH-dependent [FeFe] hydrogenase, group A6 [Aminomonas paucivorans]|uniref:NADH-dependent [FeFe] hydrogenase, group A6 n=1 Tax=Aminomonas paucivorans TaxID=81412 RepID=UPI0033225FD2
MISLNIDGKYVKVPEGSTILDAAKALGIEIPTLCHLDLHAVGLVNKGASCRVCVVEVKGRRNLAPACATPAVEGMEVKTNTIRVLNARKTVLELLLSDHPKDCLTCAKSGNCELQEMAERFCLRENRYEGGLQSTYKKDHSPSLERDMDKCVMCRRCETMCNEVQTVGVLSGVNRGFTSVVAPAFEKPLEESVCTFCGQCAAVCPTGALVERDYSWQVIEALADPEKVVVVQTAPAVRAALGEEFGLEPGTLVTGKMAAALRALGFDHVFDTDFAADLTIMEEASEFLDRLTRHLNGDKDVRLPILTSCCPAWVKFFEHQFPDMLDVPSTAKSPQQMFGAIAKSYFAQKLGIPREKMVVVSIMPCLAKKYECSRPEFAENGNPDVDISISTRELAHLIKRANIDFLTLPDEDFDKPLGESTGAAVIFGTTGGVIEAAVRSAVEWATKQPLDSVDFTALRGFQGCREAKLPVGDLTLHIGIAHGLGNARRLLEAVRKGEVEPFHAIEIMACPGGCVGGGGQPYHHGNLEIVKKRAEALYREDEGKPIRKSHENPDIVRLYEEFLGKPLGEVSHHLLHTHYFKRSEL